MEELSSSGEGQKDVSACLSEKGRFRLTKDDRVRRSPEYRKIMREGARFRTSHFSIRMLKNPMGRPRLGIAVGRKAGKACARNRIKRRLREYFRLNRDKMPPEVDIVFIALRGATTLRTSRLREELDRFFKRKFSI